MDDNGKSDKTLLEKIGGAIVHVHMIITALFLVLGIFLLLGYWSASDTDDIVNMRRLESFWTFASQTDTLYTVLTSILPLFILGPLVIDVLYLVIAAIASLFRQQINPDTMSKLTGKISNYLIIIIKSIIDILLGSVVELLEYIKLVPCFVIAMRNMLLSEDESTET